MSGRGHSFADVKVLLQARIGALAMHLAPDGYKSGRYWIAKNPTRTDRRAGSFYIWLAGPATGAWRDEATGEKGDVFGLIQYVGQLNTPLEAMQWAERWLGISGEIDAGRMATARRQVEARVAQTAEEERQLLEQSRKRAFATWIDCWASLDGTVAETYFASRGIPLADLPRIPRALRYAPALLHQESRRRFPGIVAEMTGPTGALWAIHRTWLAEDGSGKADVTPARKIWPSFSGAAIRLARGETGLSVTEAEKRGKKDRLLICEGIEDGLSVALACPELRVWAAGSLGNLAHQVLPACCAEVIVAADNDWGKPQAEALLKKAIAALAAQGRPVSVARSRIGKDLNDALVA